MVAGDLKSTRNNLQMEKNLHEGIIGDDWLESESGSCPTGPALDGRIFILKIPGLILTIEIEHLKMSWSIQPVDCR
jgi:hypothetical protein